MKVEAAEKEVTAALMEAEARAAAAEAEAATAAVRADKAEQHAADTAALATAQADQERVAVAAAADAAAAAAAAVAAEPAAEEALAAEFAAAAAETELAAEQARAAAAAVAVAEAAAAAVAAAEARAAEAEVAAVAAAEARPEPEVSMPAGMESALAKLLGDAAAGAARADAMLAISGGASAFPCPPRPPSPPRNDPDPRGGRAVAVATSGGEAGSWTGSGAEPSFTRSADQMGAAATAAEEYDSTLAAIQAIAAEVSASDGHLTGIASV